MSLALLDVRNVLLQFVLNVNKNIIYKAHHVFHVHPSVHHVHLQDANLVKQDMLWFLHHVYLVQMLQVVGMMAVNNALQHLDLQFRALNVEMDTI